jgi:glycosyltransferase involved in cell wall biosynthesis
MIYLSLPSSSQMGWGICGRYISQELARLADVRLLTSELQESNVRDELDFRALQSLLPLPAESQKLSGSAASGLDGPLLTATVGLDLRSLTPGLRGKPTVGYTFFEDNYLAPEYRDEARRAFDHIVAGSSACEQRLRDAGLPSVSTIVQGIDPALFEPSVVDRRYLRDQFVIFSGGKLELRKGHDIVVRAFKVLQDKYDDVLLMTAWHNPFRPSLDTIQASRLVRFTSTSTDWPSLVRDFFVENGIDPRRTVNLGPKPNFVMSRFYKQTDVGLFPNRCEGGTNLVLMEYMACGKPVIASNSTGHRDILTSKNSIPLTDLKTMCIQRDAIEVARWDDPDLDEVVAALEFAYQNRDRLAPLARQAGDDLGRFTWRSTAEQFHKLLSRSLSP